MDPVFTEGQEPSSAGALIPTLSKLLKFVNLQARPAAHNSPPADQLSGVGRTKEYRLKYAVLFLLIVFLVPITGHPAHAEQPSWCKSAKTETEKFVCQNDDLWALDDCEDLLFRRATTKNRKERETTEAAERKWSVERDRCGSNPTCIRQQYSSRISVLDPLKRSECAKTASEAIADSGRGGNRNMCQTSVSGQTAAQKTMVKVAAQEKVALGSPISVEWTIPAAGQPPVEMFLIGAMPDIVRFEGDYKFNSESGVDNLTRSPGFVALPGTARAPYDIAFGAGSTRIIIPIHDADVPRSSSLKVKPYAAGFFDMQWAVIAIDPGCNASPSVHPLPSLGSYEVLAGEPAIVVQDFVMPDPRLVLNPGSGTETIKEIEISADLRYRLEIFPLRYRVFERSSGAKILERSGVLPRFSPSGRFLVASVGDPESLTPRGFELVDIVAARPIAKFHGPIVGWSNSDALLIDGRDAYGTVNFISTLIDPVMSSEGENKTSLSLFTSGNETDAYVGSSIRVDWNRLLILQQYGQHVENLIMLATGSKPETWIKDDSQLRTFLFRLYAKQSIDIPTGWTSTLDLTLTHAARGVEGYVDEIDSLQPSEAGRPSQTTLLLSRRLALSGGEVLRADDLRPVSAIRGLPRAAWLPPDQVTVQRLDQGYIADALGKLSLRLVAASPVAELEVRKDSSDPLDHKYEITTDWPESVSQDVLKARPKEGMDELMPQHVGAWRIAYGDTAYLLLQHGVPPVTVTGGYHLGISLLVTAGPLRGTLQAIESLSADYYRPTRDFVAARVFATEEKLIIAIAGVGKAAIVDLQQKTPPLTMELVEPTLLCGFYGSTLRHLVVQSNCDGQFFVFNPNRSAHPILRGRVVDDEVVVYTPQMYYAATFEGAHYIHIRFAGHSGLFSFEQFAALLSRPEHVRKVVEGSDSDLPAPPALTPPPSLEFSIDGVAAADAAVKAVTSSQRGLTRLEFYEDGRLITQVQVSGTEVTHNMRLPLRPHVRSVSAIAVDTLGATSQPVTLTLDRASAGLNTLYVVAVGVDEYDRLPALGGARKDAETMVSSLQPTNSSYYHAVKATLRVDQLATPDAIRSDLQSVIASAGADDTILLFFAGHGVRTDDRRFYMAVSQTAPERVADTSIDWREVADILVRAKGRVIVVIDACHAGQTGSESATNDDAIETLAEQSGAPMVVLAASKGRQLSEELPGGSGGVFTQTLASLINDKRTLVDSNGNRVLEISEIYRGLKPNVQRQTGGRQTPWLVLRNFKVDAPLF